MMGMSNVVKGIKYKREIVIEYMPFVPELCDNVIILVVNMV